MARFHLIKIIAAVVALSFVHSQDDSGYNNDYGEYADYQDYNNDYQQEDNLYYDFAEREQQKK